MITFTKFSLISITIALLLLSSGCTKVGPDYVQPQEKKLPDSWDKNSSLEDNDVKEWWKLFNDETLNLLVEKTYEQNLDLRGAGLRILQARAALGISKGLYYPQVQTLSGGLAKTNNGGAGALNFDVGWEMDVWGKYARGIESSEATLYATIASYDDILVTIISEIARNYINFRTAQERIAFAKRNIDIQTQVAKMTEIQFNAGNVSELDMQQAKTQLFTTKSALPVLQLSMVQSRNAIAILLGQLPQEIDPLLAKEKIAPKTSKLSQLQYKEDSFIPSVALDSSFTINAKLVSRRPDIQVAELQAKAQSARIGSAEAQLYPHFSLFGSIGYSAFDVGNGWTSLGDSVGISAGPAFSWNIFQYGRIKNQVRVQDALFQESLNNYNQKVLQAVQEVSNAINGYKLTNEQLKLNAMAIDATIRAFNLSVTQYENGLVTYQRLLSTVEKLTRNEDTYAVIQGNIAIQVVLLYKALGGGWEIGRGKNYLNTEDVKQMSERTDWGEYLDSSAIKLMEIEK